MARNQEKAQSMLNRFLSLKDDPRAGGGAGGQQKRPHLASECDNVSEAERWRGQILREIGRKVTLIQNAMLGEHKIRDLNDEINKLMREKGHWERQIRTLGGADYQRMGTRVVDSDGKQAWGSNGYFYFGAARELPGVRELFERKHIDKSSLKAPRSILQKRIDADYYGFRDDDDGLLEKLEKTASDNARKQAIQDWQSVRKEQEERDNSEQELQKMALEARKKALFAKLRQAE